ncbi:MAG TPA: hypothetical protein VGQ83_35480 [Polyangia bacterium]
MSRGLHLEARVFRAGDRLFEVAASTAPGQSFPAETARVLESFRLTAP